MSVIQRHETRVVKLYYCECSHLVAQVGALSIKVIIPHSVCKPFLNMYIPAKFHFFPLQVKSKPHDELQKHAFIHELCVMTN
jgi:hypothetical protein